MPRSLQKKKKKKKKKKTLKINEQKVASFPTSRKVASESLRTTEA